MLACAPRAAGLAAPGVKVLSDGTVCYFWPLVRVPVSLAGYLALLGHPAVYREEGERELAPYGVDVVVRSVRQQLRASNATYYTAGRAEPVWWVV